MSRGKQNGNAVGAMSVCQICKRDDVGAINEALRRGDTVRVVARRHEAGRSAIGEHRTGCLRLEGRGPRPDDGDLIAVTKTSARLPGFVADKPADNVGQERTREPWLLTEPSIDADPNPRARETMDANAALSFVERSLVCADLIAHGQWEGHLSVRRLAAIWNVGAEAVRNHYRAGKVVCAKDRGDTSGILEDTYGSLWRQEREADAQAKKLEDAAEDYEMIGPEDAMVIEARAGAAARLRTTAVRYREVALKARSKLADVAGLVKAGGDVTVNLFNNPQFIAASGRLVDVVQATLDDTGSITARVAARLGAADPALVAAVLAEVNAVLDEKIAAAGKDVAGALGGPHVVETTGEVL